MILVYVNSRSDNQNQNGDVGNNTDEDDSDDYDDYLQDFGVSAKFLYDTEKVSETETQRLQRWDDWDFSDREDTPLTRRIFGYHDSSDSSYYDSSDYDQYFGGYGYGGYYDTDSDEDYYIWSD